jgi:folylpolyglutamate synthase/dihydropteroate synthase
MFKALKSALNHMADDDRLMVFGSFFTVAEVLALLQDSNLNNNNDNNIGIH